MDVWDSDRGDSRHWHLVVLITKCLLLITMILMPVTSMRQLCITCSSVNTLITWPWIIYIPEMGIGIQLFRHLISFIRLENYYLNKAVITPRSLLHAVIFILQTV